MRARFAYVGGTPAFAAFEAGDTKCADPPLSRSPSSFCSLPRPRRGGGAFGRPRAATGCAAGPTCRAPRALHTHPGQPANGSSTDVAGASGPMGYEVIDACDGWATHQQLDMNVVNADGQNVHMISDYTTWEAKDGLSFRFHTRQTTDDAVTSQIDGDAKLEGPGGAGTAHYTNPKETTKPLPTGTLFPMAHTAALLAAARAGKKFIALPLFDGTSEEGAEDSSVVVLNLKPAEPTPYPMLTPLASTRVHLAFFERTPKEHHPRLSGVDALLGERRCRRSAAWISAISSWTRN